MQIHELTKSRRVNEDFARTLGSQLITKALGGVDPLSQKGPAQSREQGFQSMVNSPEAKTLATTMQSAWAQTVKNFLANAKDSQGNPATSLKAVTAPSISALEPELRTLVNKMISSRDPGFDYSTMANNVTDPVTKQGIQEVIARINEHINAIFKSTVQGVDPKTMVNSWIKLVGDGILPAQNARAYDRGRGARGAVAKKVRVYQETSGKWVIDLGNGPAELDKTNPEHKAALAKMYGGAAV